MTKLQLRAIKLLPDEYIADDLTIIEHDRYVIAFSPYFQPIKFDPLTNQWSKIKVSTPPTPTPHPSLSQGQERSSVYRPRLILIC